MSTVAATPQLRVAKTSILLGGWLLWHLVYWYGVAYSDYPNQIHWAYGFSLLGAAVVLFPHHSPLAIGKWNPGLLSLLLLIGTYFLAFYIVSFWELFPGTTLKWGKFEIINIVAAVVYYMIGRVCMTEDIAKWHYYLAALLVTFTIPQLLLDDDTIRYGYGWQLMYCLPAAVLLGRYMFVGFALAVMLASQHKVALACALLGCVIVFLLYRRPPRQWLTERQFYLLWMRRVIGIAGFVLVAALLFPYILLTFGRFIADQGVVTFMGFQIFGEGTDTVRSLIAERSIEILSDHFPQGMGYMNFYEYTGLDADFVRTDRRGNVLEGLSLHNSYVSWALEGGFLVVLAVLLLFARTAKRVHFIVQGDRNFGALLLAWIAGALLLGFFHQLHQMMQFWGIIGLVFGVCDRMRRSH
jgi:hypothetical protein